MDKKDKLRLGICLTTSDWSNILYNKTEMYEKFDTMLKEVDEEYRTTLINFAIIRYTRLLCHNSLFSLNSERNIFSSF